jgi:hypothetical protein
MLEAVESTLEAMAVSRGHVRTQVRERMHTELYKMA